MTDKILDIHRDNDGNLTIHNYVAMSYHDYAEVMEFIFCAIIKDAERNDIPKEYSLSRLHKLLYNCFNSVEEDESQ